MITCPSCNKQNQDHYRFCLGCGAELPRGGASTKGSSEPPKILDEDTSVGGTVSSKSTPPAAKATPAARAGLGAPPGTCPQCAHVNPLNNRFCASCGFRLDEPAAKVEPAKKAAPSVERDVAAVLIALDPEGNEVGRHTIGQGDTELGRATGGVFSADTFLSPRHAMMRASGGKVSVEDTGSLNGLFRKLLAEQSERLESGQRFRIGQELLQYDDLGDESKDTHGVVLQGGTAEGIVGTVSLVVGRETTRPSYPISERGINLGRERGDVLFPDDGYVSGLHCHISYEDGDVFVTDLGSSNGTFVQIRDETELKNGDVLLMGQQLYRVTL